LIGQGTLSTHEDKWHKHSDLVYGRSIRLGLGSPGYNASFDPEIIPLLPEIVWQAFTFGEPTILPKPGRPHLTPYIFFDTHRRIGAGTARNLMGTVPCTVIALVLGITWNLRPRSSGGAAVVGLEVLWSHIALSAVRDADAVRANHLRYLFLTVQAALT